MRSQFLSLGGQFPRRRRGDPLAAYAVNGRSPAIIGDFVNGVFVSPLGNDDIANVMDTVAGGYTLTGAGMYTEDTDLPRFLNAAIGALDISNGISFAIEGTLTYADNATAAEVYFFNSTYAHPLQISLDTASLATGRLRLISNNATDGSVVVNGTLNLTPGTAIPVRVAARLTASTAQGMLNGDLTAAQALSEVGNWYNVAVPAYVARTNRAGNQLTTRLIRVWEGDIGEAGLVEADVPFDTLFPLKLYQVGGVTPDLIFDPVNDNYYLSGAAVSVADIAVWDGVPITNMGALRTHGDELTFSLNTTGLDLSGGFTIAVEGYFDYSDQASTAQIYLYEVKSGAYGCRSILQTHSTLTGRFASRSYGPGGTTECYTSNQLTPGTAVQVAVASRHTETEQQVALNGTAGSVASGGDVPEYTGGERIAIGWTPSGIADTTQQFVTTKVRLWVGDPFDEAELEQAATFSPVPYWASPEKKYILMYGDSLTQSGYQSTLHDLTPERIVVNEGRGSTGARHIAARMGATDVTMTVSGNSVSAGDNTVTHINGYALAPALGGQGDGSDNQFLSRGDSAAEDSVQGTLNGVAGTLTRTVGGSGVVGVDDEVYTFVPDAGETLPAAVPADSTWHTTTCDAYLGADNIFIVWAGSNDQGFGQIAARFDPYSAAIATYLSGEKYLFLGPITRTGDAQTDWHGPSGAYYLEMVAANGTAATDAGAAYRDVNDFLVNSGLSYAGLTATAQDLIDIARDTPPTSLKADFIHNNADGNRALGIWLREEIDGLL